MKMFTLAALLAIMPAHAQTPSNAARAVNELGVDLLRKTNQVGSNFLISPYSIQTALAMTYAGADGTTRDEMARVLHYAKDESEVHSSFAALQKEIDALVGRSVKRSADMKKAGGNLDPIQLNVANRLYGQSGYPFRAPFLSQLKDNYGAPLEAVDFRKNAPVITEQINQWVAERTQQRIQNLLPSALSDATRLVLVNAVYLKAPWDIPFISGATEPHPFHVAGGATSDVPTMMKRQHLGHRQFAGFSAVTIPYAGRELQFVILLPDKVAGLGDLESSLNAKQLAECAELESRDVILHLPKFKLAPPTTMLSHELQSLGMKTAFDVPLRSANFDRAAPRSRDDYICISEVFHKAFIDLDEKGTEAAAATAVAMFAGAAMERPPEPIEVFVDRPFLFAIQHRSTGACLFLGHVTDPR
jgi:serpin B